MSTESELMQSSWDDSHSNLVKNLLETLFLAVKLNNARLDSSFLLIA